MGKLPYFYTDSDDTDNTSSVENLKKKRKPSILKYTSKAGNVKKKCKIHSKSEPEDSDGRSRSSHSQSFKSRIKGILKHDKDRSRSCSSDDDEDFEPSKDTPSQSKYLVGRVPRPAGSKPGRGGGVAIIVKKDMKNAHSMRVQKSSANHPKKKRSAKGLGRKFSY